jgi:transposase InsO family protein
MLPTGGTRTQFYENKRRFQTHGLERLTDLPPIHHSHPFTTPPEIVERILAHPSWGCVRLSNQLKLEEQVQENTIELTPEQVMLIEKANPCYRERHIESSRPGEVLAQDTFYMGQLKGVGKVNLHAVVDTYGSYAFGFLHTTKRREAAAAVLHNDTLPFYQERGLIVAAIMTGNGREFCGKDTHPYKLYLDLNDIEHRRSKVRRPQTNGFVEQFNNAVLNEFFRTAFRTKLYESVHAL